MDQGIHEIGSLTQLSQNCTHFTVFCRFSEQSPSRAPLSPDSSNPYMLGIDWMQAFLAVKSELPA